MAERGAGDRATTATVLFTDLVGSTEMRLAIGDDRADDVRRRHDEAVKLAAATHEGETIKGTGDGLMIVFPAATQGVAGAVAVQRAVHRLNRELGVALAVRVGVSAGDVAWEDDDCFGTAVVEAARLCDVAAPGQIVVSEVVRLLAGSRGGHAFESLGSLDLKGLGAVVASEVSWEPDVDERPGLPAALDPVEATLPLVGREPQSQALSLAWKQTAAGVPQVVVVGGEPGVGKTRLVAEFAQEVHADGASVLFGRCDESLGVAYQPFAEALGELVAVTQDDERLRSVLGPGAPELARLVPSLTRRLALSEPMKGDAETERYRLFEAVAGFLHAAAVEGPVLLVMDDLHWAARPTLLLLRHLVRHRTNGRFMIVATYRDTDLARGHPLSEVLADLRRERDVVRIVLRGLSEPDVLELVASAAGHDLDEATTRLAQEVHSETEGNPFFIGQVLRHLVETAAVQDVDGRWVVNARRTGGIPEGVREVIGKRLSQLAPATNDVLAVAAVIGREFDGALLVEATRMDADVVLDALEEAEAARLVVPVTGRDDRRTFSHALVRSTLYEEIPTTRRLRIHARVAGVLATRAERGVPCLDQLAHHACEAAALGDVASAVAWARAAAAEAFGALAYEEAATWYQRAVDVLDPDDPGQVADRASLRVAQARSLRAGGAFEAARDLARRAVEEARATHRPDLLADAALVIAGDRGWSEAGRVDSELIALLEEALERLPSTDSSLRAMALARLATELYFLQTEAERRQSLTAEAVAMIQRVDDVAATVFVLGCALWGSWLPHNPDERRGRALEVVGLGRRSGNRVHELIGMMWLVTSESELGDGPAFRAAVEREQALASETRQPEWLWIAQVHRGAVALMDAAWDEAEALMEAALQTGSPLSSETVMQMYGVQLSALTRARGDLDALIPTLEAMVQQFPLIPSWKCGLAYLYRDAGRLDVARAVFEELAEDDFAGIPLDANWKAGMALLAPVCVALGDTARAEVLYRALAPVADTAVVAGMPADVLGSVHGPLALLAGALGRWGDAERHFTAALEADERMGCVPPPILLQLEWGRLLAAAGDARAEGALRRCRDEAAAVGMVNLVARCDRELALR